MVDRTRRRGGNGLDTGKGRKDASSQEYLTKWYKGVKNKGGIGRGKWGCKRAGRGMREGWEGDERGLVEGWERGKHGRELSFKKVVINKQGCGS